MFQVKFLCKLYRLKWRVQWENYIIAGTVLEKLR